MLERLFKLDVSIMDLGPVVTLAQIANFFSKLFEVVSSLHHLYLLA